MKDYPEAVDFHRSLLTRPAAQRLAGGMYGGLALGRSHKSVNDLRADAMHIMGALDYFGNNVEALDALPRTGDDKQANDKRVLTDGVHYKINKAATTWIDPDVVAQARIDGVEKADAKVPLREHIPFVEGSLMMLGAPIALTDDVREVQAVWWFPTYTVSEGFEDHLGPPRLTIVALGENPDDRQIEPVQIVSCNFGEDIDLEWGADTVSDKELSSLMLHLIRHLARQDQDDTRISVVDAAGSDRGAKRAVKKSGGALSGDVNVIYLRRNQKRVLGDGSGASPRRHLVRAHWRHQPYGPKHALRKWVLVEAHERGKGDLDTRDRVYVDSGGET